jgi:glycosyltransferase involved in cell wall biosynthesis
MKIAVVIVNYGPYHLARARALNMIGKVDASFIELASSVESHPWLSAAPESQITLRTMCAGPFEERTYREMARALTRSLDEIDPEVVITTSFRPFIMLKAARWARSHGKRTIFFYETTPWDKHRSRVAEAVKRIAIARYYDAAFAGGTAHRDYLLKLGMSAERIWGPYDVVDNKYFAEEARKVRLDSVRWREKLGLPDHYFLYVGRLSSEKNLLRLVEAHRLYMDNDKTGWPLVIVGDGPQRNELQEMVSDRDGKSVILKPFQQVDVLPGYYALAECLVLASTVDPWGLVVNEAMASGLPILVSTLCGSGLDLVEEGRNGFHFDPYDIAALSTLMARITSLSDCERRKMAKESEKLISNYRPEVWADRLVACAEAVMLGN